MMITTTTRIHKPTHFNKPTKKFDTWKRLEWMSLF